MLEGGELSLREVARRAGVAPGAPYHHFEDKRALLLALAEDGFEALGVALAEAVGAERDARVRLRRMVETYVRFALAHGPHYRLMFPREVGEPGSPWHEVAAAAFRRLAVAAAAARPDVTPDGAVAAAAAVWALCHGAVTLRLDGILRDGEPFATLDAMVRSVVGAAEAIVYASGARETI